MDGLMQDPKAEIARLEQQIAALQGGAKQAGMPGMAMPGAPPQPQGGGLMAPAPGSPGMNQIYGLMAQYGDNPGAVGEGYVRSQQAQQQLDQSALDQMQQLGAGTDMPSSVREWEYYNSLNEADQKRYLEMKRSLKVTDVGGVPSIVTGSGAAPLSTLGGEASAASTISQAQSEGSATGTQNVEGRERLGSLKATQGKIEQLLADPDFDGAVGPIDQLTGRIGAMMGTREGTLGARAEMLANQLVSDIVDKWKGAISEKELAFFERSKPSRGDSPAVWRDWYVNIYKPEVARLEAKYGPGVGSGGGGGGGYAEMDDDALLRSLTGQ